jgi:hypothetical protein
LPESNCSNYGSFKTFFPKLEWKVLSGYFKLSFDTSPNPEETITVSSLPLFVYSLIREEVALSHSRNWVWVDAFANVL